MTEEKEREKTAPARVRDEVSEADSAGDDAGSAVADDSFAEIIGSGRAYKIILSVIVLAVAFITFWFMMELVILTFILTFVFYHFQKKVEKGFAKVRILRRAPHWLTLIIVYLAGLTVVVIFAWGFTTIIIGQANEIGQTLKGFDINSVTDVLDPQFVTLLNDLDVSQYINKAIDGLGTMLLDFLQGAGSIMLHFGMAIVISLLFLLERENVKRFGAKVSESRIGFIYDYFIDFGGSFCRTFGKVMKVQVTIALVNCLLSSVFLHLFGMPNVLGLGALIFVLGLIPVAGVLISIIPLAIIAFNTGGVVMVLEILIMVAVLHAVEAYVLNPKLMAHRTALPVSFVFVILLVAERYLGLWGLLIGVPLFIFIATVFRVDYEDACKQPPSKIAQSIRRFWKARAEDRAKAGGKS
ncbi:MAG: AI-2E family transporter [Clostridiales Family XIII bacterium]|jgi:predicted PurR-regulated permease PerM|nr:AI-2E family transporter [Clostridiales Family XIII bacterium]